MKIVFLPIDNRPVCYQLPKLITDTDDSIELILPDRELLGDLTRSSIVEGLIEWLLNSPKDTDAFVLSLDTIAYGGLIPSRRSSDDLRTVKTRLDSLKNFLQSKTGAKVYAFSSIMRISNNNVNEEEKDYWNLYGEKIFKYSFELDKFGTTKTDVPTEILEDYLATRNRNFEINKLYLEWQKEGIFETLIFSKDDCAQFGLNVQEARALEKLGGYTKTGADEIPLTLLARAIPSKLSVHPTFTEPDFKNLISNYEDISIEQSVLSQLELADIEVKERSDVELIVNNFKNHQGEIVMKRPTELYSGNLTLPNIPWAVADVRNANGADNEFVSRLLKNTLDENFSGYAGWNTSANTLGTIVCTLKVLWRAKQQNTFSPTAFKKLQIIRFLDDMAYQANVRQQLPQPDMELTSLKMKPFESVLEKTFDVKINRTKYSFPWNRLFEIEVDIELS